MAAKKKVEEQPWGLHIDALGHSLSGNKSADIDKLLGKAIVEEALLKAAIKKLEIIIDSPDSIPEEIEAAAEDVKLHQGLRDTYKVGHNVIHKDRQAFGSDKKPLPIIAQHFIHAAFRDESSASYSDELNLATPEKRKGRVGKAHMRKHIQTTPYHIFLYKDAKYKHLIEDTDIILEGQQPVMDVKGFSRNEVISGPFYFNFNMTFHPKGKFPGLADKDMVIQILHQATFRGLGGRRAANYGQWQILKAKIINYKRLPFTVEGK